jgi:hypothetical protein
MTPIILIKHSLTGNTFHFNVGFENTVSSSEPITLSWEKGGDEMA